MRRVVLAWLLSVVSLSAYGWGIVNPVPGRYVFTAQHSSWPWNVCYQKNDPAAAAGCALVEINARVEPGMNCTKTIGEVEWQVGHSVDGFCQRSYYGALLKEWLPQGCPGNSQLVAGSCTCDAGWQPSQDYSSCVWAQCPEGQVVVNGQCACAGGTVFAADGVSCAAAPSCTAGQVLSSGMYEVPASSVNNAPPMSVCDGNCGYQYEGASVGFSAVVSGVVQYFAQGSYVGDGWNCENYGPSPGTSAPGALTSVPPDTCPPGELFVQNEFGFVCMLVPGDAAGATAGTSNNAASSAPVQASTMSSTSHTVTNPDGSTTTTTTGTTFSPPLNIQFPSDYARGADVAALSDVVGPKLQTLHEDLSKTDLMNDPLLPVAANMPSFGSTFDGLTGWTLPGHVATCPTANLDLSGVLGVGSVYSFDAHCTIVQDHWNALRAAMLVVWSMSALFIVLRA